MKDAEYWNNTYLSKNNNNGWETTQVQQELVSFLDNNHIETAIDVGCGAGFQSNYISTKVNKVDAFDISEKAIGFAKEKYHSVNFFQADLLTHDLNKHYDLVFDRGVFHHTKVITENPKNVTSSILKLLGDNSVWISIIASSKRQSENGPPMWSKDEIYEVIEPELKIISIQESMLIANSGNIEAWCVISKKAIKI